MGSVSRRKQKLAEAAASTAPAAPAVITDRMWETKPGEKGVTIHNMGHEPMFFESKTAYLAALHARGLRMKDQQESSLGPALEPIIEVPESAKPTPPPPKLTQGEVHILCAMKAFFLKHGIREALYCLRCYVAKREAGCFAQVHARGAYIRCRCGIAGYDMPDGTTDMVMTRYTNLTHVATDKTEGFLSQAFGGTMVPTVMLHDNEALIIASYMAILKKREYEPLWFCNSCYDKRPTDSNAMGLLVSRERIAAVCQRGCRMLVWQDRSKADMVDSAVAAMKASKAQTLPSV